VVLVDVLSREHLKAHLQALCLQLLVVPFWLQLVQALSVVLLREPAQALSVALLKEVAQVNLIGSLRELSIPLEVPTQDLGIVGAPTVAVIFISRLH
jgi:hypothetical protein